MAKYNSIMEMEAFKRKYPKLSKIIEIAINCGLDVEYDMDDANRALSWYNSSLQTYIRKEMQYDSANILNHPFMVELKNGDLNSITLCDYIFSVIGENPIEAASASPFIFRTDCCEYTMDENFKITKWRFSVSEYDRELSNGQKYTDVLNDILTKANRDLISNYNASESDLAELYRLLHQLVNSNKTNWQILKYLEQSKLFNYVYSESILPFLLEKKGKEYIEMTEILYS